MATRAGVGECSTSPTPHGAVRGPSVRASRPDTGVRIVRWLHRSCHDARRRPPTSERASVSGRLDCPRARRGGARGSRRRCAGRTPPRRSPRARGDGRSGRPEPCRLPRPFLASDTVDRDRHRLESAGRAAARRSRSTADRTCRVSGTRAWPGRATIQTRTRTPSSETRAMTPAVRRRTPATADPPRPTRMTPGTSNAASRTISRDDVPADGQLGAAHGADSRAPVAVKDQSRLPRRSRRWLLRRRRRRRRPRQSRPRSCPSPAPCPPRPRTPRR